MNSGADGSMRTIATTDLSRSRAWWPRTALRLRRLRRPARSAAMIELPDPAGSSPWPTRSRQPGGGAGACSNSVSTGTPGRSATAGLPHHLHPSSLTATKSLLR